jgi:hypothetical protein
MRTHASAAGVASGLSLVCGVAYTLLEADRWLRLPARFFRWRPDRSPEACLLEQLAEA